jgi:hypothetical protein
MFVDLPIGAFWSKAARAHDLVVLGPEGGAEGAATLLHARGRPAGD